MRYIKPEVVPSGSAIAVIQRGVDKPIYPYLDRSTDPGVFNATAAAYEADE